MAVVAALLGRACRGRASAAWRIAASHRAVYAAAPTRRYTTDDATAATATVDHVAKEPLTPLAKQLQGQIKATGPLSVAHFMRQALTHPVYGYYMKRDVFGSKGDFTTSPEVSQMFGELLGVWLVMQWQGLGKPNTVQLVELGPGRGTLMDDMLRVSKRFPAFRRAITGVHLVEVSPELRRIQETKLCEQLADGVASGGSASGIPVRWHGNLEEWSTDAQFSGSPLLVAHEFLDAMPIHVLEKTKHGWREVMVDLDTDAESEVNFRFVLAPSATALANQLTADARYANLEEGARVEISPDAWGAVNQMARIVGERGGSAMLIDYGNDFAKPNTLRGIRNHRFCDLFTSPGEIDLTADVDFSFMRTAAQEFADVHGPVTQRDFLHRMGIQARLQMLLRRAGQDRQQQRHLIGSYNRLTDVAAMGSIYKFLTLTPKGTPTPVAFEALSVEPAA
ncbi:S-adenosyl-L-methionine-dependent methyltransferase [Thamnocephalis sphaerospora]|uniref:Protein arginine methyltransferase NDUFAF7 n=1 Tax=Thamnocephalis sphaerospora TaxID=78915 RepID=A0A4P9XQS4_9FUNG|nr:S-adenosyl-L-methionine-dependent methyltransferase [Thamnocephalis sphaerospora]|eukprot:RKP08407.1 S-adenosyl-L-methionine-dependent methyltransferase [Thamnocephalis sphaerospora]